MTILKTFFAAMLCTGLLVAKDFPRREFGNIDSGLTIPHFASGDGTWGTEFQIFGLAESPVAYTMSIFDDNGNPLELTLTDPGGEIIGTASFFSGTVGAGLVRLQTPSSGPLKQGYVVFESTGSSSDLGVTAIITSFHEGNPSFRTFVPGLGPFQDHVRMPFTEARGFFTGVAYKNDANQNMTIIARDTQGVEICRKTSFIQDGTHRAFLLRDELPCTQGKEGLLEIVTDFVGLTAVGLTFDSDLRMWTNIPFSVCCFDVN